MSDSQAVRAAVAKLYNTYPFPPDPLLDAPPPGYNWRWNWIAAYNFCTRRKPSKSAIRILDAGCGTGVGTEYLVHLNPHAQVVGIDLSEQALAVAEERCRRSGAERVTFHHLKLEDAAQLPGEFDFINCVGVLHHLPDPVRGIQALAAKLAPGGLMHIFVYAELGRWEIRLMQQAIALLQTNRQDYTEGVQIGRKLLAALPEDNPLVRREKERWSLDNQRDACFADMYVHPQEIDYNIETLFALIAASELEFVGFSNPQVWQPQRLLGQAPQLIERIEQLGECDRYRTIELLDPHTITHYEFFLARPPLAQADWSDDRDLLNAIPERHPCLEGWESRTLFNYDYQLIQLSEAQFEFLRVCDVNAQSQKSLQQILAEVSLDLNEVRSLLDQQLIVLTPSTGERSAL